MGVVGVEELPLLDILKLLRDFRDKQEMTGPLRRRLNHICDRLDVLCSQTAETAVEGVKAKELRIPPGAQELNCPACGERCYNILLGNPAQRAKGLGNWRLVNIKPPTIGHWHTCPARRGKKEKP